MKKNGFTLVEILAVLVIIGVLMVVAVPSIFSISDKMKDKGLNSKIDSLEQAAVSYAHNHSNKIKSHLFNGRACDQNKTMTCNSGEAGKNCKCVCDTTSISSRDDCKYSFTITVDELIELGAYKSETPDDLNACDVVDPRDSNKCLDCVNIQISLDDDYESASAKIDKNNLPTCR